MSNVNYLEIWKRLSNVAVGEFIESKNGFDYLSWSRAWALLMDNYPHATFEFGELVVFPDGSAEVHCTITIGDCSRSAFLAVMDFRNKAILKPNATDIQNAKQRVFVKAIAMFGLGYSLYLGEQVETVLVSSDELLDQVATIVERDFKETFLSWKEFRTFVKELKGEELGQLDYETVEKLAKWLKSPNAKDVGSWPTPFLQAYNSARLGNG